MHPVMQSNALTYNVCSSEWLALNNVKVPLLESMYLRNHTTSQHQNVEYL